MQATLFGDAKNRIDFYWSFAGEFNEKYLYWNGAVIELVSDFLQNIRLASPTDSLESFYILVQRSFNNFSEYNELKKM